MPKRKRGLTYWIELSGGAMLGIIIPITLIVWIWVPELWMLKVISTETIVLVMIIIFVFASRAVDKEYEEEGDQ